MLTRYLAVVLAAGMLTVSASGPSAAARRIPFSPAPSVSLSDRGVFLLSVAERTIGSESFEIRSSADNVEAQAEIRLRVEQNGKTIDLKTFPHLILDAQLHPLNYTWSQKGPQSSQLEVDFRSSPAKTRYKTVTGEEDRRDFALPKDVVVLDDNVVHHYQLVVARYQLTPGGKQTFQAFIPQEALPGVLNVEDVGMEAVTVQGSPIRLRHLVVTTENARINLWVDDQQRLQRVSIPEAQLEAIRTK